MNLYGCTIVHRCVGASHRAIRVSCTMNMGHMGRGVFVQAYACL